MAEASLPLLRRGRTARWRRATDAARAVSPASTWRRELSQELRRAAGASYAAVLTCPPGDWSRLRDDCDPLGLGNVAALIMREFVPRFDAVGEGWQFALGAHGTVYAPLESARAQHVVKALRTEVLAPAGVDGWVVGFFVAGGLLVGLTAVGAEDGSQALLGRSLEPLEEIVRAAGETLGSAIALAEACGAQVAAKAPAPSSQARLTAREQEIASLAAAGFANLNVAVRLGIAEGTVAVHLKNLYAKLRVHSRAELAQALRGE